MTSKGHILVLNDDDGLNKTLQVFLNNDGYQVTLANSYETGIHYINQGCIDVAFIGIHLNGGAGIKLLHEINRCKKKCSVIIIAQNPDLKSTMEALRLLVFDFLSTPILPKTLLHTTHRALEHKKKQGNERKMHSHHTNILQSVRRGILTIDKEMRITFVNDNFEKFFKLKSANLVGSLLETILAQFQVSFLSNLNKCIQTKTSIEQCQTIWINRFGQKQDAMVSVFPLAEMENSDGGAILLFEVLPENKTASFSPLKNRENFHGIIGKYHKMERIYTIMETLAKTDTTVLITGETGTGKGFLAKTLHQISSRVNNPFINVTCSALSEQLLESEMFGHVKGAFTGAVQDKIGRFQMASGGTIFLDEMGDVTPAVQVKLLKVIEEKEFERVGDTKTISTDIRIIAATNRPLHHLVKKGLFRADLYYRLKIMEIIMPPLRERIEDIILFINYFREFFNTKFKKAIEPFPPSTIKILKAYHWPGNIRELKHAIEHAFILAPETNIYPEHLPPEIMKTLPPIHPSIYKKPSHLSEEDIYNALRKNGWNKSKTARSLGIGRQTLYRKMDALKISESNE